MPIYLLGNWLIIWAGFMEFDCFSDYLLPSFLFSLFLIILIYYFCILMSSGKPSRLLANF